MRGPMATGKRDRDGGIGEASAGGVSAGLLARAGIGGLLMGMANLVPGISGGTMLLASGVYRAFIGAVAEVTMLTFRARSLAVLGMIVVTAGLAIALLAGPVVHAVVTARWAMYSLFIGLTLGGAPMLARMIRNAPGSRGAGLAGVVVGFVVMGAIGVAQQFGLGVGGGGGIAGTGKAALFLGGIAGASAMVLPGVSGGYLLLVLGQYVPILASIHRLKEAASAGDAHAALAEWSVIVPVGLGVVVGIVGVSNLLKWLLARFERATLGVLLGLLLGAVVGLWPFQRGIEPREGDVHKGQALTAEAAAQVPPEDWALEVFSPGAAQVGGALGLVVLGFVVTLGVARLGRDRPKAGGEAPGKD